MQNTVNQMGDDQNVNYLRIQYELRGLFSSFFKEHKVIVEVARHNLGKSSEITGIKVISNIITNVILRDIDSVGLQVRNIRAVNEEGDTVVQVFCELKQESS